MPNSNTLTAVTPKLLALGLLALRENAITPRLVNSSYDQIAGQRGSTIDVPIPSAVAAIDVVPDVNSPDPAGMSPTSVPVALNLWKEAPFFMTDKDQLEVMDGFLPMQASEAIKSLANAVDLSILTLYTKFYGFHGTPGTAPFGDANANPPTNTTTDATQIRKVLNKQLAPLDPRYVVFDPDAEARALDVRAFHDMSFSGDPMAILEGRLERRLGFGWFMNQNVQRHTAGTLTGTIATSGAGNTAGVKTLTVATDAGEAVNLVAGDIITIAGHTQTYVVTATATIGASTTGVINIEPGLLVTVTAGTNIAVKASHTANLAFHRDAFAFATRPLQAHGAELGVISRSAVDPVSGLTLRVEITHEHKRLRFSYDILWGVAVVRRELGARLAG